LQIGDDQIERLCPDECDGSIAIGGHLHAIAQIF